MDDRARWARKEKVGEGYYMVDLVETFFCKIDFYGFPVSVFCLQFASRSREACKGRGGGRVIYVCGRAGSGIVEEEYFYWRWTGSGCGGGGRGVFPCTFC